MDVQEYKEVYFHQFCKKCKHWELADNDDPCDECLSEPVNLNSHRPVNYDEKGSA